MKELTIQTKIKILNHAIKYLKRRNCYGMCTAIDSGFQRYDIDIVLILNLHNYYPDFTHDNYMKFYSFNKTVKAHANCSYWDSYNRKIIPIMRRVIFLRYLILKLRIQQFKQWYTILH